MFYFTTGNTNLPANLSLAQYSYSVKDLMYVVRVTLRQNARGASPLWRKRRPWSWTSKSFSDPSI